MISSAHAVYDDLLRHTRQTSLLGSIESLLEWDERTYMPAMAGEDRAEQITLLAGLIHQRSTDPRLGEWFEHLADSELADDPHSDAGANLRELKRRYDKRVKLPQALVEELARTSVLAQQAWVAARKGDDFAALRPHLEKMFRLKREQADAVGYGVSPYDALLDDFEPGTRAADIEPVLAALRDQLAPLLAAIAGSGRQPKVEILARRFPVEAQRRFGEAAAARIGFDFQRGRLDVTAHPFCTGMGPHDCRITTRYDEEHFPGAFFGILHEAGHGIYDQGLRPDVYGQPCGQAVSLGIHESQSRMWENLVGRSRQFWQYFFPQAQAAFPESLGDVSLDDFHFAINDVRPSLIRVEADEVTYNLHVLIRFELERAVVDGHLAVADLPAAWNEKYSRLLGIAPPNDRDGVLQDIHWSAGLIGYFPTYALGNLYASQFFAHADRKLGGLAGQFARGEFAPLREWLQREIHARGSCFTPAQLVEKVTGRPLSPEPLLAPLRGDIAALYRV